MNYDEIKADVIDWILPPEVGSRFHVLAANYDEEVTVTSASYWLGVTCREEISGRVIKWQSFDEWRKDRLCGCITQARQASLKSA